MTYSKGVYGYKYSAQRQYVRANDFGPLPFKAAGKPPVTGGRWSVRRLRGRGRERQWRAWTKGSAASFNRFFATQAEAIAHATTIAQMFTDPTPARVSATLRRLYPKLTDMQVAQKVVRFAKFPKPDENGRVPTQ